MRTFLLMSVSVIILAAVNLLSSITSSSMSSSSYLCSLSSFSAAPICLTLHYRTINFPFYSPGKIKPHLGENKIWSSTTCLCQKFDYDEKYIMFGSENSKRQRLAFESNDRLLSFNIGDERVKKWVAKCKKRKC